MLASLHALNLFKRLEKMRAGQTEKPRFKLRRRVRAKSSRARGSTESADDESSSGSDSRSSDIPMAESDRPGSSDGLRPGEARPKNKRGIPWGRGKWKLAEIWSSTGQLIGCGATCGGHVDEEGNTATCKKASGIWEKWANDARSHSAAEALAYCRSRRFPLG